MVSYGPSRFGEDKEKEEAFKKEHLEKAVENYKQALQVQCAIYKSMTRFTSCTSMNQLQHNCQMCTNY